MNGNGELQIDLVNSPIIRKNAVQPKGGLPSPTNGKLEDKRPMKYGNGTLVNGEKIIEVQTFERYLIEKNTAQRLKQCYRFLPSASANFSDASWIVTRSVIFSGGKLSAIFRQFI